MKLFKIANKQEGQLWAKGAYITVGRKIDNPNTPNGFYVLITLPISVIKTTTNANTFDKSTEPCKYQMVLSWRRIRNVGILRPSFYSGWTPARLLTS
jgi:hypothetical protein